MNIALRLLQGLALLWSAGYAGADDLGAGEWPATPNKHTCVVISALTTPTAWEFYGAFSRHWCLQGWSVTSQLLLRESRAEKWLTRIDILRNDELMLTVPMSPYVEQNVEKVAAAVVDQMAARLMQMEMNSGNNGDAGANADNGANKDSPPIPGAKQPGGERK
ncbi:MAG: hypothetical protein ACOY9J_09240 [Pseudomonadota bacterium]